MADILDPRDFDNIRKSTQESSKEMKEMANSAAELTTSARSLSAELDDILQINRRRTVDEKELLGIAGDILNSSRQNFEISRKGRSLDIEKFKVLKARADIERELTSLTRETALSGGQDAKIKKELIRLSDDINSAESQRVKLLDQVRNASEEDKESILSKLNINKMYLDSLKEQSSALDRDLATEAQREVFLEKTLQLSDRVLRSIDKQVSFQREVNQVTGITGELLEGVNRIGIRVLGGLGVNLGVISESFEKGRSAMTEFGKEVARTREIERQLTLLREVNLETGKGINKEVARELGLLDEKGKLLTGIAAAKKAEELQQELINKKAKSTNDLFARTQALVRGVGAFSGELGKILTDPAAVLGIMVKHFNELNKSSIEFQRLTGNTAPLLDTLNTRFTTSVQILEVATAMSEKLGMNVSNTFSAENLAAAAELRNLLGITAEAAGQLALVSEIYRTSVDSTLDAVVSQVNAYNRVNRTALNHGQIVNDIAKASEETLASFAGQPEQLAKSAAAARRLGMELAQIERIADTLLDFESSIENELQAQLLTGLEINLAKARELSLTNQIGEMGEEIFNNTVEVEKFSRMNRIQQQGLAQALGMSRQELAKIALQRSIELGLTNKALEAAAGVTAEDLKRLETMQTLSIAVQKVGQALATPLEMLAAMAGHTNIIYGLLVGLAAGPVLKLIRQFRTLVLMAKQKSILAAVTAAFTNPALFAAGAVTAAGATALIGGMVSSVKDGVINPSGGLMVSGPKGSIQLDPQDSIIAGTNLTGGASGQSNRELISKIEEMIAIMKQGGDVFLDGDKVGSALVMGSYRNS